MRIPKITDLEVKERPAINSSFIPSSPGTTEPRSYNLDALVYWVKRTPECIGILKRIATDIVTEVEFVALQNKKTGRPKKIPDTSAEDKAKNFWRNNQGRNKLVSAVIDWLLTGDAYIWKGKVSDNQIKELGEKYFSQFDIEFKEIEYKAFLDEDYNTVSSIEVVPSSMTEISHTEEKILKYVQKSKVNTTKDREFSTEEIIHAKFMDIDGKIYGYSPMEAGITGIKMINAIQDYSYNYFANGVKLDRAWMVSGNINQTFVDKLEENLAEYKKTSNFRGDMVIAGGDKITVHNLNEASEKMEFRQLAIHTVGRIAFSFNMPADILSSILGVDVKGTAVGSDIEDAGYNRNIMQSQIYWEDLLNTQLFIENFGVEISFTKTFKQDQIRQIQYLTQTIPVVEFLFRHKYPVSDEYVHNLLQIPREFLTTGSITREVEQTMPFAPPNKKPVQGDKSEALSKTKQAQQKPQAENQVNTGN